MEEKSMRTLFFILGYLMVAASLYTVNPAYCWVFVGLSVMTVSIIEYKSNEKEKDDDNEWK